MAHLNTANRVTATTHEGGNAYPHLKPLQQLRRSVLSCLLWEREFYEDGQSIADRIKANAALVTQKELHDLAVEARTVFNLRHVPLLLATCQVQRGGVIASHTVDAVIQRADELSEILAVYWQGGRRPLSAQLKKGLAKAFTRFNEYQLAKYNRDGAVKLRDVLRLCHAKPETDAQAHTWKHLLDGTLPSPDTWEVALSSGSDKKETWERLLREGRLGYLALLRNLRNMQLVGVQERLIRNAIQQSKGAERVLPFRYVAAARAAPMFEPDLDVALCATIESLPKLSGTTFVLVDVSGSMDEKLSGKSDLTRMDAAATLASIINAESLRVFTFSEKLVEVAPRRGMAGVDVITKSQQHSSTNLGGALSYLERWPHDRLIVITDEQTSDRVPQPIAERAYMINVASAKNGVGYGKNWLHLDGFSENIVRYIHEHETANLF